MMTVYENRVRIANYMTHYTFRTFIFSDHYLNQVAGEERPLFIGYAFYSIYSLIKIFHRQFLFEVFFWPHI